MMDLNTIGAYIAMLRRDLGLSQRELAGAIGVSFQAVSKWENGENLPDACVLLPLAEVLHTTVDELLSAGAKRLRQPIDMAKLHTSLEAIKDVLDGFGEDSTIGRSLMDGIRACVGKEEDTFQLDAACREALLAEAIIYRLQQGDTLAEGEVEAVIRDEALRLRVQKCKRDCALFVDKQQVYDECRPGYPAAAVEMIRTRAGRDAVMADIGSGTGKLAVLLASTASSLWAVEPNAYMRRVLTLRTEKMPQVRVVAASAEKTHLPDHSVDAITVAEAYHWFDNDEARREFRRILKPDGYVFLLWNHFGGNPYDEQMREIARRYRTYPEPKGRTEEQLADDTFGVGAWEKLTFDNTMHQTFDRFYGGMTSASYAPQPGTVEGKAFRQEVKKLFDQYAEGDRLVTHVTTVCYVGQMIARE